MSFDFKRLWPWLLASILLAAAALWCANAFPGNPLAVTLYKMHLMSLGGWGGYWLDCALFPYDRPHTYLEEAEPDAQTILSDPPEGVLLAGTSLGGGFHQAMLRRAIVVAAALICVGLGA